MGQQLSCEEEDDDSFHEQLFFDEVEDDSFREQLSHGVEEDSIQRRYIQSDIVNILLLLKIGDNNDILHVFFSICQDRYSILITNFILYIYPYNKH